MRQRAAGLRDPSSQATSRRIFMAKLSRSLDPPAAPFRGGFPSRDRRRGRIPWFKNPSGHAKAFRPRRHRPSGATSAEPLRLPHPSRLSRRPAPVARPRRPCHCIEGNHPGPHCEVHREGRPRISRHNPLGPARSRQENRPRPEKDARIAHSRPKPAIPSAEGLDRTCATIHNLIYTEFYLLIKERA